MKKIIIVVLALTFLLTGCKSEAVKDTETLIDNIGTVSLGSESLIVEAQQSYDALTDKEKEQVSNYQKLLDDQSVYQQLQFKRWWLLNTTPLDFYENIMDFKSISLLLED